MMRCQKEELLLLGVCLVVFVNLSTGERWRHLEHPGGCTDSTCTYQLNWRHWEKRNTIDFQLVAKVPSPHHTWAALAWNTEPQLSSACMVVCTVGSKFTGVQSTFNHQHTNIPPDNPALGLSKGVAFRRNSSIHCNFSISTPTSSDASKPLPLNHSYYLLMTHGTTGKEAETAFISPHMINLLQADSSRHPLLIAHGSLMIVSWLFFIGLATLVSRHLKHCWHQLQWGAPLWFQVHRGAVLTATVLIFISLLLIFSYNHWTFYAGKHSILGLTTLAFILANVFLGATRPNLQSPFRRLFNLVHGIFGHGIFLLGVVTIFFGLRDDYVALPGWMSCFVLVFASFKIFLDVLLEFSYRHDQSYEQLTDEAASEQWTFRNMIVVSYLLVSFCVSFFLILFLIFSPLYSNS